MPLPRPLPDRLAGLIACRFRALAEPARVKLLDHLRDGEASVQELTDALGTSQQNVSQHMAMLHQAGIVKRRKEGNFVRYEIADPGILTMCEQVCGSLQRDIGDLHAMLGAGVSGPGA